MGAAVIWSYIELFGHQHLAKAVFLDQVQDVQNKKTGIMIRIAHDAPIPGRRPNSYGGSLKLL